MPPARPMLLRHALRAVGPLAGLAALSQAGCYFSDAGLSPPHQAFYYPTGLAVSPGSTALYVANSDFDLQFNGGTVQVVDLARTRATLATLLSQIRCLEARDSGADVALACAGVAVTPQTVKEACHAVPYVNGGLADASPCNEAVDCASGVCNGGSDSVVGQCVACKVAADCNAGGQCVGGVCALEENTNPGLTPSVCTSLAPALAGGGTAFGTIGAFASGAVIAAAPPKQCLIERTPCEVNEDCLAFADKDPARNNPGDTCDTQSKVRLFVPVRGDPSVTWFDVGDDRPGAPAGDFARLDCGSKAGDTDRRCSQEHKIGLDPYENFRSITLPVEPNGLDVSEDGTVIVTAHQIAGAPEVGLSLNPWPDTPSFQFYLGTSVGAGPTEVARVPVPELVKRGQRATTQVSPIAYQPGFLVSYNATPEIDLFRYNDDALSSPRKPFLTRAASASVSVNADGKDSRGLIVDPTNRQACEALCAQDLSGVPCLRECLKTPLDLYVANRAPPSLLLGHVNSQIVDSDLGGTTGSAIFDTPQIYGSVPLTQGPSKVALGKVIGTDGKPQTRVFAVSFDTNHLFSYDPVQGRVDVVISTGPGPHPIAVDTCADCNPSYSYLYVGHFTESYLGVVDLDMRHPETFGIMFAAIGTPLAPTESK